MGPPAHCHRVPPHPGAFDADTHFLEPPTLWHEYLEHRYRRFAPALRHVDGRLVLTVDDRAYPGSPAHAGLASLYLGDGRVVDHLQQIQRVGLDPSARVQRMNELGVCTEVVYPTIAMMGASAIRDPHLAGAHCRAYNRFAADHCAFSQQRLAAAMIAPLNHPQVAADEIRYAREELDLRVVYASFSALSSSPARPECDAVWATAQDLDVTVTFQESSLGAAPPLPNSAGARSRRLHYLSAHVVAAQLGIADLILGRVLERFPRLRVGLQETHLTWLPAWLQLLDERSTGSRGLSTAPSDYFRKHCFTTAFPDEPGVRAYLDAVGRANLLFASDWPHRELVPGTNSDWTGEVHERPDVNSFEARAALVDNSTRWFPGVAPAAVTGLDTTPSSSA